jgi:hypothetical protein
LHATFGLTIEKLWGFEDFSPNLGMLLATVNAGNLPKSAKICPKLPKLAKIPPKIEILVFLKNKNFYL